MPQTANVAALARLTEKHRGILSARCERDSFLSQVAEEAPSHQFLGRSAQMVNKRQIEFLAAVLADCTGVPVPQVKILDWGCGKGHITHLLQARGFDVTSCDLVSDKDDSTFGQQTPIIRNKGMSVVALRHRSKLPFEDESFDCVVSFGVLEHVSAEMESLQEVRRILKPGGLFFVTYLPYYLSWTQAVARLYGNGYHDRLYDKRSLAAKARAAGYELVSAWHGQLFPKNSVPITLDARLEPIDRFLCRYTVLKYLATNLEGILVAV